MLQKLLITKTTSPEEISEYIKNLREQKGKEKQTLEAINKAFTFGHDFVVNLFFEEALTYQHMVMNDPSNKAALLKMQESVFKAEYYIKKYKLTHWNSRLFRYKGRLSDYKKDYKKAVEFYKKSIYFVKSDSEPFRRLELEAFLSYSQIMSGKYDTGYKLARKTYNKFFNSKEGKNLRSYDNQTWGIWASGITIRTINAFLDKKLIFKRGEFENWLFDTEKLLKTKKDFSYRLDEIKVLKKKLLSN